VKPNVLWICTDQQRWDTLGCYGNRFVRTPNLDRLAAGGALFDRCYTQSPVCTPSRASFLTGRYPRTTRCRQNGQDIPADEVLVTKMLVDAGYVCGLSGKLHLSACDPHACQTMERRIDDGYSVFHWSHDTGGGWGLANEYRRWLEGKGATFETPPHPLSRWVRIGMPEELHQTTWCVERAADFIRERASARAKEGGARPWLFSVNTFDPHHPFDAPKAYLEHYEESLGDIPLPDYHEGELAAKPPLQRVDHAGAYGGRGGFPFGKMTETDHRLVRASYWAMCDLIDAQVGRLLDTLDETGQAEDTIVMFTSDHGEMLGEHGIYLKGPYFYEPAVRVPLVISWPGHVEPMRTGALVELVDLAQTLLDAAGLPHHQGRHEGRHEGMQGRSLWPLLTGAAPPDRHRDDVYCEYYGAMPWHGSREAQLTMVRTDAAKIVADHSHRTGELYDLEQDPGEHRNLWDDPASLGLKAEMLARLADRMAWTVDPLPARRADW
jgi:choline-sulfatase